MKQNQDIDEDKRNVYHSEIFLIHQFPA